MSTNYANAWNQVAQEAAEAQAAELEHEPTGEIDLGDGCRFIGRRLPLERWLRAGKLPQALLTQVIRMFKREQRNISEREMSADDLTASLRFQADAICYVVVEPKLVRHDGALHEGEVRYSDFFDKKPEWVDRIMTWVTSGCPGVPVATKGGDVSIENVKTFPDGARRSKRKGGRKNVPILPGTDAQPAAGHPVQ